MNINKLNLEVGHCASKEESRYHLSNIHFTQEYTEASNGHILARITYPIQFDPADLPENIKTKPKEEIKDFLIPLSGVKEIKFQKKVNIPCLADVYVDVDETNNNGNAKFISTDLQTTPITEIKKIDGEFPDSNQIFPTQEPVFEICLDPSYLEIFCKITKEFGKHPHVKLTFYNIDSPVLVESYNQDTKQNFTGLIMPMRGEARDLSKKEKELDQITEDYEIELKPFERNAKSIWKNLYHIQRCIKRLQKKGDN